MKQAPISYQKSRKGFSLAEVAIAVGITAVGVVALLGLLSTGLGTMREAANTAAEARISQFLVGQVMLTDWDQLSTAYPSTGGVIYEFDDQAIQLQPTDSREPTYTARVRLPEPDVKIPGDDQPDPNLRRVLVDVASVPNITESSWFDDEDNKDRFRTYSSLVTNMGKSTN